MNYLAAAFLRRFGAAAFAAAFLRRFLGAAGAAAFLRRFAAICFLLIGRVRIRHPNLFRG